MRVQDTKSHPECLDLFSGST